MPFPPVRPGDECFLNIGNNNEIREYCSIHCSSKSCECKACKVLTETPWPTRHRQLPLCARRQRSHGRSHKGMDVHMYTR
ncbi:unnamed protein product [Triticum turgidum subsp. durum]|uniref:Uncharacterized protein n=1 Tax=Triticum turgidum subsp. durum TaxID=4567 RepID=A0A9R0V6V8_TRITD|nr:unnamed protein product [Triticum turgidum subsp. durum]